MFYYLKPLLNIYFQQCTELLKHSFIHIAYSRNVTDLADLRQRIVEAVELITPHMVINTWQELEYRLDICRATTGALIEAHQRA
jgi:hypothetical protein